MRRLVLLALCALLAACGDDEREASVAPGPTVDPVLVKRGSGEEPTLPAPKLQPVAKSVREQLGTGEVGVVDVAGEVGVRPARMQISKGTELRSTRWIEWSAQSAKGTAKARVLDCDPSCAKGTVGGFAAEVELSEPKACPGGIRYFGRAKVTYVDDTGEAREPAVYIRPPC